MCVQGECASCGGVCARVGACRGLLVFRLMSLVLQGLQLQFFRSVVGGVDSVLRGGVLWGGFLFCFGGGGLFALGPLLGWASFLRGAFGPVPQFRHVAFGQIPGGLWSGQGN